LSSPSRQGGLWLELTKTDTIAHDFAAPQLAWPASALGRRRASAARRGMDLRYAARGFLLSARGTRGMVKSDKSAACI
jgi:hypothetical protein